MPQKQIYTRCLRLNAWANAKGGISAHRSRTHSELVAYLTSLPVQYTQSIQEQAGS